MRVHAERDFQRMARQATSDPSGSLRALQQCAYAPAVERLDCGEVCVAEGRVDIAYRRNRHVRRRREGFQKRDTEIQMAIVAARDQFRSGQRENRPRSNRVAHSISGFQIKGPNLAVRSDFGAQSRHGPIAGDQQNFHPGGMVRENRGEKLGHRQAGLDQRRAITVPKGRRRNPPGFEQRGLWYRAGGHGHFGAECSLKVGLV